LLLVVHGWRFEFSGLLDDFSFRNVAVGLYGWWRVGIRRSLGLGVGGECCYSFLLFWDIVFWCIRFR